MLPKYPRKGKRKPRGKLKKVPDPKLVLTKAPALSPGRHRNDERRHLFTQGLQRCSRCQEVKDLELDYSVCRRNWTGRLYACEECVCKARGTKYKAVKRAVLPDTPLGDLTAQVCGRWLQAEGKLTANLVRALDELSEFYMGDDNVQPTT